MNIVLWITQILLAGVFIMAGTMKTFQYERAKATLPWVKNTPRGLVTFIGVSELLGGVGLLLPALTGILPWLTPLAAVGLGIIMVLAIGFHSTRREVPSIAFNVLL